MLTDPGAGSARPSTVAIGWTSRTVDDRNASSARARSSSDNADSRIVMPHSRPTESSNARVTPNRQPESAGGVVTTPSRTTKTFEPVASHSSPRVLQNNASCAPRASAYASARTFSAYEIVFNPAHAPRSLRDHGTTTTSAVRAGAVTGTANRNAVGALFPRLDPGGAGPPVT